MHRYSLTCIALLSFAGVSLSSSIGDVTQKNGFVYLGSIRTAKGMTRAFSEDNYYVGINPATWNNAESDCKTTFGSAANLLAIETTEERDQLNVMLESYGSGYTYWTAGIYDPTESTFRWASDYEVVPAWDPWDPTNGNFLSAAHRIALAHRSRFSAFWRTLVNTQLHRYICEFPN